MLGPVSALTKPKNTGGWKMRREQYKVDGQTLINVAYMTSYTYVVLCVLEVLSSFQSKNGQGFLHIQHNVI